MYIWGKGRATGRVGSDFLLAIAGRVGLGQRFTGSGRVQESGRWTTLVCAQRSYTIVTAISMFSRSKNSTKLFLILYTEPFNILCLCDRMSENPRWRLKT